MKKMNGGLFLLVLALLGGLMLTGCPKAPPLTLSPAAVVFGEEHVERRITLDNSGSRTLEWTLDTVVRESVESPWQPGEVTWLDLRKISGRLAPGVEHLTLAARRTEMAPGAYTNAGVRIRSRGSEQIVPVSMVVGRALQVVPAPESTVDEQSLQVDPVIVQLRHGVYEAAFTLENRSPSTLTWTAAYFDGADTEAASIALPADIVMTPAPGNILGARRPILVTVKWTTTRSDFGLRISSPEAPGHDVNVIFRFSKPFTDLGVTPTPLLVYHSRGADDQPQSKLTLRNSGVESFDWKARAVGLGDADEQVPLPIRVEPASGTLTRGGTAAVAVSVTGDTVLPGSGNYTVEIEVPEKGGLFIVPLIVESRALPVVVASAPPDPNVAAVSILSLLDLGRDDSQQEFYVVNIGPLESRLFFRITHEDEGAERPLILSVTPVEGSTNDHQSNPVFFLPGTSRMIEARRIVVTVDRSVMTEDVEYRTLRIEAWDEDYKAPIEAVKPFTVNVRVERSPMKVEGAINRSRPPFLMRFVFLLRDTVGQVISTRRPGDLDRIRFVVSEDDVELDLNEVAMQIKGPDQLKVNLVLMLDYTGSLYRAGVDDPDEPRAPGEVLNEVRQAAAMFLDDIPPGYRVALMYHNDRQPLNRLIHPFSTDRESLKAALFNFSMPPYLHGTSDIWDALNDAVRRIAAQDPPYVLPFDDADVRAVLFISDGHDNSSVDSFTNMVKNAQDARVRLYPLAYSAAKPINYPDLLKAADDTGGYLFTAGAPENLRFLLGGASALVLEPVSRRPDMPEDTIEFAIYNAGNSVLNWNVADDSVATDWIKRIAPASGTTQPGARSIVAITADPTALAAPVLGGRATLRITSSDGRGEAQLHVSLDEVTRAVQQFSLSLRDEPGRVWGDLQNQVVLEYVTPRQTSAKYSIRAHYRQADGNEITAMFEEDGLFYPGDVRAGQISLHTTGITINDAALSLAERGRAEVYLRADYVPRGVNTFRMRFVPFLAEATPAMAAAFAAHEIKVELAPDGLLLSEDAARPDWRLINEGDGIYRMLTPAEYVLPYAASGNLLRLTFTNLLDFVQAAEAANRDAEFFLDMRVDNTIYFAPQTDGSPSSTVYFLYPTGPRNPDWPLRIGEDADWAGPALTVSDLVDPGIDPAADGVWDRDEDGILDFNDPYPDDSTRPGRLTQPAEIVFLTNALVRDVTLNNNRWDSFSWGVSVQTSGVGRLRPEQFTWTVEAEAGTLSPGEAATLRITFNPGDLSSGRYFATLVVETDTFGIEQIPITIDL